MFVRRESTTRVICLFTLYSSALSAKSPWQQRKVVKLLAQADKISPEASFCCSSLRRQQLDNDLNGKWPLFSILCRHPRVEQRRAGPQATRRGSREVDPVSSQKVRQRMGRDEGSWQRGFEQAEYEIYRTKREQQGNERKENGSRHVRLSQWQKAAERGGPSQEGQDRRLGRGNPPLRMKATGPDRRWPGPYWHVMATLC
ncbi:uncharacterized protein J3D65DRAFT_13558 [Phyllosticta citribraziliensis]|uniref:Secreted protein n=1 Tax=Phyllosticta citribraziliensis TaxID=989973 RepID=A0ABR1M8U7_9PEZI